VTVINRPLLGTIGDQSWRMDACSIPLPDASCAAITCLDVLEYVREDDTLLAECARVLKPGGVLHVRVPNAGPVAGIDSLNFYHYIVDITGRRLRPAETDEVGWRRHYSAQDLADLLKPWFTVESIQTRRLGIAALVETGTILAGRWLLGSQTLERRTRFLVRRIERAEDRIHSRHAGWSLVATARRRCVAD
jgi:SAM-dependent methyltransferase